MEYAEFKKRVKSIAKEYRSLYRSDDTRDIRDFTVSLYEFLQNEPEGRFLDMMVHDVHPIEWEERNLCERSYTSSGLRSMIDDDCGKMIPPLTISTYIVQDDDDVRFRRLANCTGSYQTLFHVDAEKDVELAVMAVLNRNGKFKDIWFTLPMVDGDMIAFNPGNKVRATEEFFEELGGRTNQYVRGALYTSLLSFIENVE